VIQYAYGTIHNEAVFDSTRDRYLVLSLGWQNHRRVHSCLIHIDILGDKVWIQRDGTEDGIAFELVDAGIPKHAIVLGFQSEDIRPYTEFAVA
jgi:hypothetical protein